VDTLGAVVDGLYTYITTDGALMALMGGAVELDFLFAPQDETVPYLQCRVTATAVGPGDPAVQGTYSLRIWDRAGTATRVFNIRARLMAILDGYEMYPTGADAAEVRIAWVADQTLEEPVPDWWCEEVTFSIRYIRAGEARP